MIFFATANSITAGTLPDLDKPQKTDWFGTGSALVGTADTQMYIHKH